MEEALLDMKKKYNELLRENMDAADGPTTVKIASANDEVSQLKDELKKREVVHSERIVEMVCERSLFRNQYFVHLTQFGMRMSNTFFNIFANSLHIISRVN